jgi:pantoate--beta-alanine ligase
VREPDRLALSSRNVLLSPEERERARALPLALDAGADAYARGGDPVAATREALNGLTPDYVELFDLDGTVVLATAVRVGSIRLIDNVVLKGDLE